LGLSHVTKEVLAQAWGGGSTSLPFTSPREVVRSGPGNLQESLTHRAVLWFPLFISP